MSVKNPFYGEMERNPICLNLPWKNNDEVLQKWENGKTGYPFIDAVMRQLHQVTVITYSASMMNLSIASWPYLTFVSYLISGRMDSSCCSQCSRLLFNAG